MIVVRASHPEAAREVAERVRDAWERRGTPVRLARTGRSPDELTPLTRARDAYHALRPEEARGTLEAWLERAEHSGAEGLSRDVWLEGLVWLALARLALHDEPAADAALDRALAVAPDLSLDEIDFPPPLRERLEVRRGQQPRRLVPLRVESSAPDAVVYVDAASIGRAPAQASLAPGLHLVRLEAPGRAPTATLVALDEDAERLRLTPRFDPERALAAGLAPGSEIGPELERAARELSAYLALLDAERRPEGWRLALLDLATGQRATVRDEPDAARAAERLVGALELADRVAAQVTQPSASDSETSPPPDAWPWVALGSGAAALLGAAIAIAVWAGSQTSGFSIEARPVP